MRALFPKEDTRGVPTLPSALAQVQETAAETFQQPKVCVGNSISQKGA